jgi:hypothetical protein
MSAQSQSNQQNEQLRTVRLSLPASCDISNVRRMRLVGSDLVLYVPEADVSSVSKSFNDAGFSSVDRVYKLHVSAASPEAFKSVFTDSDHEYRGEVNGRHIYTVTVDDKEDYDNHIASSTADCTVKAFRSRFANAHRDNTDAKSDTKEQVKYAEEWTKVKGKKSNRQDSSQGQKQRGQRQGQQRVQRDAQQQAKRRNQGTNRSSAPSSV